MRIVHWAKYYPPHRGGMEIVAEDLAVGTAERGHDVAVVAFTGGKGSVEVRGGVTVVRTRSAAAIASQPLSLRYVLAARSYAAKADVVHIHLPNMLAALPLLLTSRRKRVLLHWHSDVIGKGWLGRVLKPIESFMLRRADSIIATSRAYAESSPALRGLQNKVTVVPLGIADPRREQDCPLPARLRDFVGDRPLLLAVGRLVPYKGFSHLIRAAATMTADVAVVVVGGGPLYDQLLAEVAGADVGSKVLIAGPLPPDELTSLFSAATGFVMSSVERSEAFGVVLLEAMAHGLPIIAPNISGSGVPWVVEEGRLGRLVPPYSVECLAAAMDDLVKDKKEQLIYSERSRRRFETLFTRCRMVEGVLSVTE